MAHSYRLDAPPHCPTAQVAGGYISQLLAREYGLGNAYNFGMYVREIAAQGVVDLIDVNMLGWIGFLTPAIVGLISIQVIDRRTAPLDRQLAKDSIIFVVVYGWMWLAFSLLLHFAGMYGRWELRKFYGIASVEEVKNKVNQLKSKRSVRAKSSKKPARKVSSPLASGTAAPGSGAATDVELNPPLQGSLPSTRTGPGASGSKSEDSNREWLEGAQELSLELSQH